MTLCGDEEHSNNCRDKSKTPGNQRKEYPVCGITNLVSGECGIVCYQYRSEAGSKYHGPDVLPSDRFEEIGSPPSDISHIIPNKICYDRGVSWIIFRNPGFNLSHEISGHIGCLGVNSTTELCEQRGEAGSETEPYNDKWCLTY